MRKFQRKLLGRNLGKSMEGIDSPRGFAFAWSKIGNADIGIYSMHRLITIPKKPTPCSVARVEPARIAVLQPLHPRHQIGFRRLNKNMIMIAHKDKGMHAPAGPH